MRIANVGGHTAINETDSAQRGEGAQHKAAIAPPISSVGEKTRDRQALDAARAAMGESQEIDTARVAEIRAALAAGDIRFDAAKLAGMIQRYHGGHE